MNSFHVDGMKEMRKTLLALKIDDAQKMKMIERSLRKGVGVVRKKVRRLAPGKRIPASFRARVGKGFKMPTVEFAMGGRKAPHAHLVEFGTQAHTINIKRRRVLSSGEEVFGTVVDHPGTKPQPFFRPAIESSVQKAGEAFAKNLRKELDKVIAKNRKVIR